MLAQNVGQTVHASILPRYASLSICKVQEDNVRILLTCALVSICQVHCTLVSIRNVQEGSSSAHANFVMHAPPYRGGQFASSAFHVIFRADASSRMVGQLWRAFPCKSLHVFRYGYVECHQDRAMILQIGR
jgi:hypothetical protein